MKRTLIVLLALIVLVSIFTIPYIIRGEKQMYTEMKDQRPLWDRYDSVWFVQADSNTILMTAKEGIKTFTIDTIFINKSKDSVLNAKSHTGINPFL